MFVGGSRDHWLAIAVDDRRYRIRNLTAGEVAIYSDQGDKVVIKRGGTIEVTASTKVVLTTPVVELAGNTEAAVKGTTYRAAEDVMLTALSGSLTAAGAALNTAGLDPTLVGLATTAAGSLVTAGASLSAVAAAISTFTGTPTLSTKVKLS